MTLEPKPYYLKQLERTFEERVRINPRYSLRAFARDIAFSAPRLSMVLNAKFGLSRSSAVQLCLVLSYDAQTTSLFVDSVEANHHRSPKVREQARIRLANKKRIFSSLELDQFTVISDWHHFAIMELIRVERLKRSDHQSIAQSIGISWVEAKNAIERLLSMKLLAVDEEMYLIPTGSYYTGNHGKNTAIRKHNTQLIHKALTAVENQTAEERELRTMTLAIAKENLPEFSKLFNDFQAKVRNLAEKNNQKTDVYAWTMQFFNLSERKSS